jgi:hypothetical protein
VITLKNFDWQKSKVWNRIKLGGLVVAPILFLILPADYFDSGESVCLSVRFFDQTCYACGLTRSMQHMIHLEFGEAYAYNKLVLAVFPLIVYLYVKEVYVTFRRCSSFTVS